MSLHYLEDISTLYPQIPTSVDDTAGLLRALKNGTEEVNHLLRNSCNLILECRCCKSIFRHAKYFHKHKMSICRAYHRPIAPTYEEVLAFQKQVAIMWDSDQPSTSKQAIEIGGHNSAIQMVENEPLFTDSYDGIEEFCGESGIDSPEPGELVDGGVITFNSEKNDNDEIEEGEYMEWNSDNNYHPAQSLIKANDDESDVLDRIDSSNTGESDAISLTESPLSNDHLSFPIFNDQLLESPTRIDYFGKNDKVSTLHSGYAT